MNVVQRSELGFQERHGFLQTYIAHPISFLFVASMVF